MTIKELVPYFLVTIFLSGVSIWLNNNALEDEALERQLNDRKVVLERSIEEVQDQNKLYIINQ